MWIQLVFQYHYIVMIISLIKIFQFSHMQSLISTCYLIKLQLAQEPGWSRLQFPAAKETKCNFLDDKQLPSCFFWTFLFCLSNEQRSSYITHAVLVSGDGLSLIENYTEQVNPSYKSLLQHFSSSVMALLVGIDGTVSVWVTRVVKIIGRCIHCAKLTVGMTSNLV